MKTESIVWMVLIALMFVGAVTQCVIDPDQRAGREYVKQVDGEWVPATEIDRQAGIAG